MKLTSANSPLRIAECPGLPLLGMTLCPGKTTPGLSGDWDRDLETDVAAIKAWGACLVVTLMEDWELEACQVPNLGEAVRQAGMIWWQLPVLDGSPLELRDGRPDGDWDLLCALLRSIMALGCKVLVHCRGGLGRTGTLAARLLIEEGFEPAEALKRVRSVRPGAVETAAQEDWLFSLGEDGADPQRSRARACLLGGALAEAAGARLARFWELDEQCASEEESKELQKSFRIPGDRLEIGACTQLALVIGDALLRAGCAEESASRPVEILAHAARIPGLPEHAALGSVAPLALFSPGGVVEAHDLGVAALAGADEDVRTAAGFWAAFVHALGEGQFLGEEIASKFAVGVASATVRKVSGRDFDLLTPLLRHMESIHPASIPEALLDSRLAIDCVRIALICGVAAENVFRAGVLHAADSDHQAALPLTGQLLGLSAGEYFLPEDWLAVLDRRALITAQADALAALPNATARARRLASELWPAIDLARLL